MNRLVTAFSVYALFSIFQATPELHAQYGRLSEWFGANKAQWNLKDCEWQVLKGTHADVYYCPGVKAIAQAALAQAEASEDTLKGLFGGVDFKGRRRIVVYSPGHVQETNIWHGFVPENVAGWYEDEDNLRRTVAPFAGDYHWFNCVLRHELVHNFQGDITRRFLPDDDMTSLHEVYRVPLWWTEGEAEYRAGNHGTCRGIIRDILLRDLVLANKLPSFVQLANTQWGFGHYIIGFEAHRYLAETYGDSLNVVLYRNLGLVKDSLENVTGSAFANVTNNAFAIALEKTYGIDLQKFSVQFLRHLRLRYLPQYDEAHFPMELSADSLSFVPEGSTPIRVYQHNDKTYALFFSEYDGQPTFYRVLIPERDSAVADSVLRNNQALQDSMRTDEAVPDSPSQQDSTNVDSVPLDSIVQVVFRGGGNGHESVDPQADIFADSLLVLAVKDKQSYVLVVRDIRKNTEIIRRRFENVQIISSPSWSPDGSRIVFSGSFKALDSDSAGVPDIYLYERNTDILKRLTRDVYYDGSPQWQPNGNLIVFESDGTDNGNMGYTNLFLLDPDSGERRYLTRGDWHDNYPSWSQDGRYVVFRSDRKGTYDAFRVDMNRSSERLTKYWGSTWIAHSLPGDSAILFLGFYEGTWGVFLQDLPVSNLKNNPERITLSVSDTAWHPIWQWEGSQSKWYRDVVEGPYSGEHRVDGFCGASLAAGYGYGTGCGLAVTDFFDDHWYFASFGTSNYSWVPGRGRFNVSAGFVDIGGITDYAIYAYYQNNPMIDIPIRHAFDQTAVGVAGAFFHPFSRFLRLETNLGIEYVNQRDLYDWTNPYDLNHTADTLRFKLKGVTLTAGTSLVGDNALGIQTGPVVGYRYRIGALATVNLSRLVRLENDLAPPGFFSEKPDGFKQSPLTNFILHGDARYYVRLGLLSTLGLRLYGFYSDGQVPTYVSFGKLNGMAAFYPWNSPYGSRGWMANARMSVPVMEILANVVPIFKEDFIRGIQGELFFDMTQAWFRNNNLGPIYGGRGVRVKIPFAGFGALTLDKGSMFLFPLGTGYKLPYRSTFGIGFGTSF